MNNNNKKNVPFLHDGKQKTRLSSSLTYYMVLSSKYTVVFFFLFRFIKTLLKAKSSPIVAQYVCSKAAENTQDDHGLD